MKKTHGRKSRWTFPLRGGNYIFWGTTFFCVLSLGILFLSIILLPSISYKCLTNLTSIRHKLQASDTSYKLLTYLTSYKLLTYLTSIWHILHLTSFWHILQASDIYYKRLPYPTSVSYFSILIWHLIENNKIPRACVDEGDQAAGGVLAEGERGGRHQGGGVPRQEEEDSRHHQGLHLRPQSRYILLAKFWRISLFVTYDAIAKLYMWHKF